MGDCTSHPPENKYQYSYTFNSHKQNSQTAKSITETNKANVDINRGIVLVDSTYKLEIEQAKTNKNNETLRNNDCTSNSNNDIKNTNTIPTIDPSQCGARESVEENENMDDQDKQTDIKNQDAKINTNQLYGDQQQNFDENNFKLWFDNQDWRTEIAEWHTDCECDELDTYNIYNTNETFKFLFDEMNRFGHDIEKCICIKKKIVCKLKKEYQTYGCKQNDNVSDWRKQYQIHSMKLQKKQSEKALKYPPTPPKAKSLPPKQSSSLKSAIDASLKNNHNLKMGKKSNNLKRTQSDITKTGKVTKQSIIDKMKKIVISKTKKVILAESEAVKCCCGVSEANELAKQCPCLERIEVVLQAYDFLLNMDEKKCEDRSIADMIQIEDKYEHLEIENDFEHIRKMHIDEDNNQNRSRDHDEDEKDKYCNIPNKICRYFESKFPCKNEEKCCKFRHCNRAKSKDDGDDNDQVENLKDDEKTDKISNDYAIPDKFDNETNDAAFRQECEKIHGYFFHSSVKNGTEANQIDDEQEEHNDRMAEWKGRLLKHSSVDISDEEEEKKQTKKKAYVGKKEDNVWLDDLKSDEKDDEIYQNLMAKMGVFRWQNPHGFVAGQNREIGHYKPKFKNPKEEALHNPYSTLSPDSWNQTVAKSKIFLQSWAGKKIRTAYKGYYDDKVTGQSAEWKEKDEINIKEIVTFKLYTDFDKLQFELKKCFRYETVRDIINSNTYEKAPKYYRQLSEQNRMKLEKRLECFYNWRGQLLIALNKFGIHLNAENNRVLYHGVNKKMLIKPSQTFAFSGPLSTSTSYHVARTFATAKGMVLKMTSHFPRLNYCNAFDVSSLSDYPEEDEWLVGFMYVRLLEVRTRILIDHQPSFQKVVKKVPMSSWIRQGFFAIHLFKEQIFSMNEHLQRVLAECFKVNRYECCRQNAKYANQDEYFKDVDLYNEIVDILCRIEHKDGHLQKQCSAVRDPQSENSQQDLDNFNKLCPILWHKFTMFCMEPNIKQRVKFDMISENLKRFFMEEIEQKENVEQGKKIKKQWRISWDEITTVYPNVREIHFVNQYKLSNEVLRDFLKHIKSKENKIEKVLFLYYNYKNVKKCDAGNQPSNNKIFQDPAELDSNMRKELEELKWKLKHGDNGKSGYKIRIYKDNSKT